MNLELRHFIFAVLILLVLLVGIPVLTSLSKEKPDYTADNQRLAELQRAVNAYARQAGQYPLALGTLVPNYVASVPKTSTGEDFQYNYETGQVSTPYPRPKGMETIKPTTGNIPLMGDAITGLSVNNELDF